MTTRPRSHVLETQSRNRLEKLFSDAGWIVSDIKPDYGEDLLVRIFEKGIATPYYFYIQLKATDKIERLQTSAGAISLTIPLVKVKAWLGLVQPVFLILWNAPSNEWHWCHVQSFFRSQDGQKRLGRGKSSIRIPMENRLTARNIDALTGIVRDVTTWSTIAQQSLHSLKEQSKDANLVVFGTSALTDVSTRADQPIVMIEEIETSLHPEAAQKLLKLLRNPKVQIGFRLKDRSGKELFSSKPGSDAPTHTARNTSRVKKPIAKRKPQKRNR